MRIKRIARISEEVKKVVSDLLLNGIKDPRISSMATVTDVKVTNDLSYAKIYISVLGNEKEKESTIEGLNSASGFIRSEISKGVKLRHTPKPIFLLDESIEQGMHISKILSELKKK